MTLLTLCLAAALANPAEGDPALAAPPLALSTRVDAYTAAVAGLTPDTCAPTLEQYFADLEAIRPEAVDYTDARESGARLIQSVFAARVATQAHLGAWTDAGTLTSACLAAVRRADLANRYLVDHLYEALPPAGRPDAWLTNPAYTFANPATGVRSGDVLVTRAELLSSAGIAHMGRIDSQFSHNALVWVDAEGEPWVVEAYLELGTIVEPLATFLGSGLGRVVVLRYADATVAATAAERAFDRVTHGRKIHYDDDFSYTDHRELFCSEVPPWAFELAGVPDVPSRATLTVFPRTENPGMFAAMGISADLTSAPSDILYDPRFAVVAEWRDLANLERLRVHDAVVESVMRWMEQDGYVLDIGFVQRATVIFGKTVRNTPVLGLTLRRKLSKTSDLDFLTASLALNTAAEAVNTDMEAALERRESELLPGDPRAVPSYDALRAMLEQIRADDLARWRANPKDAHFHGILHPPS